MASIGPKSSFAQRNRDRVIVPAMDRRLAELDGGASERFADEARLIREARATLLQDVLLPLTDAQFGAMEGVLNEDDRSRLVRLGVAHGPDEGGRTSAYLRVGRAF